MTPIRSLAAGSSRISTRTLGRVGVAWALAYLPIHVYWALGGTSTSIGITNAQPGFRTANWAACVVIVGAGLTCTSLTTRWGELLPAALRRGAAWLGGALGLVHWALYSGYCALRVAGLIDYPSNAHATAAQLRRFDWANLGYFELWFGVMGALLLACARRHRRLEQVRGRRRQLTPAERAGTALCLAGIAVIVWGVFTFDAWLFAAAGPLVLAAGLPALATSGRARPHRCVDHGIHSSVCATKSRESDRLRVARRRKITNLRQS